MKTNSIILILSLCVTPALPAFADYEISWSTIDAGGGRSTFMTKGKRPNKT